jgi:hypothetical protein
MSMKLPDCKTVQFRASEWSRPFNLNFNGTVHSTGEVSECMNRCEGIKGEFKRGRMRVPLAKNRALMK